MSDWENCRLLDTQNFHVFLQEQMHFQERYRKLDNEYHAAVKELLENWEGEGANAFRGDVAQMERNLLGLWDVMEGVTSILLDVERVFGDVDAMQANLNYKISDTE